MRISDWSSDVCSSDLIFKGDRRGTTHDGNLDFGLEAWLPISPHIKPIDRIGNQVLQNLHNHTFDGADANRAAWFVQNDIDLVTTELGFMGLKSVSDKLVWRENLGSLTPGNAEWVQNSHTFADAFHFRLLCRDEIGRAACRERVCQFVSISGFD